MSRRFLWASLALAPVTIVIHGLAHPGNAALFVLSAASLIPLAWLIGESTEHAAEHTGHGVGGFINASFGNAPELIIALFAVSDGLPQVVRGSLAGSIISNLLLVFGVTQLVGPEEEIDRRSLGVQLGLVAAAAVCFILPAVAGYTGPPERHAEVEISIPVSVLLLLLYLGATGRNLHRHRSMTRKASADDAWTLRAALVSLALATIATAFVSEILVNTIDSFAKTIGASEFFIAGIVLAIVGNSAEHGGAVVIARAGKMKLASEIAISSSAQVALLVTPVVMLVSIFFKRSVPLAFRWEELSAIAGSVVLAALSIQSGRTRRQAGAMLLAAYGVVIVGFLLAGNR